MKKTTIDPAAIRDRVAALPNVEAFAERHGLTLRTLQRIVASAKPGATREAKSYRPSNVTLAAIAAAFAKVDKQALRRARVAKSGDPA